MKLRSLCPIALVLVAVAASACSSDNVSAFTPNDDASVPNDLGPGDCELPNIRCGRVCANPAEDPGNCGGCGINCGAGRVCVNGRCDNQCPAAPSMQTRCGDRCTDTNIDRANCGACGTACPAGLVCAGGTCQIECGSRYTSCSTSATPDGGMRADASTGPAVRCADLRTDDQHCGACGNACPLGYTCVSGACELRCPSGQTACDGRCVELMTSSTDCGACGNACVGRQRCVDGMCSGMACPSGTTNCSGACVDTMTSLGHCGACGMACPSPQYCRGGRCTLECPTGRMACSNRCVDTMTDRAHCGGCGMACGAGQDCVAGACRLTCPMGTTACASRCVDLTSDRLNCGACGTMCGPGQLCNGGSCAPRCADTQTNCGGVCVDTAVDPGNCGACGVTCGPGYACGAGFCRALVGTDVQGCAPPSVQCGPVCADIRNDNTNCGRCGARCTADRLCVLGMCVAPCDAGQARCGATCSNVLSDRTNCGRCGNVCSGTLSCVSGVCSMEPTFRVDALTGANCQVVDEDALAGDDRGGIAISTSQVFYTGDTSTVRASLTDLSGLAAVGQQHDGFVHDLASGEVYVLMNAAGVEPTSFFSGTFRATQLGVVNGTTGITGTTRIPLSTPLDLNNGTGIFSGRGRAYIHNGGSATTGTWFQIRLPSGAVTTLRTGVATPPHSGCESWAYWGVAEFFDSEPQVVFAQNGNQVSRYRIRDGMTTALFTPMMSFGLSDMCSLTISPTRGRWYFHYEGSGFAGGTSETMGFCDARSSSP